MTLDDGRDGERAQYAERLTPPLWLWIAALAMTASLGIAYGAAYGTPLGIAVFAASSGVVAALLVATSPTIRVDERVLRAGRARLPICYAGSATALAADEAQVLRSTGADPRAHLLLRTWASGKAVKVEVTDPEDPHPYWLITSRRPHEVVAAIDACRPPTTP